MKTKGFAGIILILILVSGCTSTNIEPRPPIESPDPKLAALDLEGTWNFWMRHERGIDNTLVRATMVVDEQNCDGHICTIRGKIIKPQITTAGTQLSFSGHVLPEQGLIRFSYGDQDNSSNPLLVIVEFDIFLRNFDPDRAMVGYFTIFDMSETGPLREDTDFLIASNRGEISMAGRVTAWPIIIEEPNSSN
jgi:hypothetical protein